MSLSVIEYLRHILDETEYLMNQVQGLTYEEFLNDPTLSPPGQSLSSHEPAADVEINAGMSAQVVVDMNAKRLYLLQEIPPQLGRQ